MSVVDDVRKAMQDFLAPELRDLAARIEALEKHIDHRFNTLEQMLALSQRVARLEERESHRKEQ